MRHLFPRAQSDLLFSRLMQKTKRTLQKKRHPRKNLRHLPKLVFPFNKKTNIKQEKLHKALLKKRTFSQSKISRVFQLERYKAELKTSIKDMKIYQQLLSHVKKRYGEEVELETNLYHKSILEICASKSTTVEQLNQFLKEETRALVKFWLDKGESLDHDVYKDALVGISMLYFAWNDEKELSF